ncbi:MAG: hypothetical protein WHS65_12745 [Melioribacteraceae bacterium]
MKWFAIFKTGKHTDSSGNTKEWTEADLDKIVSNYDPLKHEAPIVIGHPKTNAPAFGWVEKLKRVGDTLYALPKQLAQEFVEMVNKGLFKKRSISLYPDGTLRHVGFLGAQPPAVKGLPDVEFNDADIQTYDFDGSNDIDEENKNENIEKLEKQIAEYKEQIEKLKIYEQKASEIDKLKEQLAAAQLEKEKLLNEIQKTKREMQLKEFNEFIEKKIAEGKLLPKQVPTIKKLYEKIHIYEYSEKSENPAEIIKEFIESMPKIIDMSDKPKQENKIDNTPVSKILAEEIRKQMNQ